MAKLFGVRALRDGNLPFEAVGDAMTNVWVSSTETVKLSNAIFGGAVKADALVTALSLLVSASKIRGLQRRVGRDLTQCAKQLHLDSVNWDTAFRFSRSDFRQNMLFAEHHGIGNAAVFHCCVMAFTLAYAMDQIISMSRKPGNTAIAFRDETGAVTIMRPMSEEEKEQGQ